LLLFFLAAFYFLLFTFAKRCFPQTSRKLKVQANRIISAAQLDSTQGRTVRKETSNKRTPMIDRPVWPEASWRQRLASSWRKLLPLGPRGGNQSCERSARLVGVPAAT